MYEKLRLNAEKVAKQVLIDLDFEGEVDSYIDLVTRHLVLRLQQFVYTSETKSIQVPIPDGVWQHIKQDYMPTRFLAKYPVRYKHIVVEAKEAFPEYSYLAHNKARHLHLRLYEPFNVKNVHCGT